MDLILPPPRHISSAANASDAALSQSTTLSLSNSGTHPTHALMVQNRLSDVRVQTSYADMAASSLSDSSKQRPAKEDEWNTIAATRAAIEAKLAARTAAPVARVNQAPQFIRYTPNVCNSQHASGASQRLIRITDAPVDPFQPYLGKHKKLPSNIPSDAPVPVLHSPPRKMTAKDYSDWKIPPCVSNWKNPRGYTIALDKRLTNDGSSLQSVAVSDKFAMLSESLFVAEKLAREEVELRAQREREERQREKMVKEEELRQMAIQARQQLHHPSDEEKDYHSDDREDDDGRSERDEIRRQRLSDRRRQLVNPGKMISARDEDRDISEKIALGNTSTNTGNQLQFDSRLFDRSEGLTQGLTDSDSYNVYDRPLFSAANTNSTYQYRPSSATIQHDSDRRAFIDSKNGDGDGSGGQSKVRSGPVEFERDDSDPFGIGSLLTTAPPVSSAAAASRPNKRRRDGDDDD